MNNGKSTKPPCTAACPAGIDVPRYIRYIREGKFDEALAVIRERIPFPAVCGHACVHPCEARCARVQYDEPVAIRMLKRAASEHSKRGWTDTQIDPSTGKKVAVTGAGPCGLTAAFYLAGLGHGVTVFEALPLPGGMLRYGIPAYRLPKDVLDTEISVIKNRGVEIITNTRITSPEELLAQGFDAVLVTVGAWKSLNAGIEGEEAGRVLPGLAFLQDVNSGHRPEIGKKVVVVGGGNTAVDAARVSVRLGAEVTIVYRRTMAEMPAGPEEVKDAVAEGVNIQPLAVPVKVTENAVICMKTTPGPTDRSGRPTPVPVAGSEFSMECDTVIIATGQSPDAGALNLAGNDNGTIKVDETLATSKKGVFAAGDAVTGPSSIIEAIAQGRLASISVDRFLGSNGRIDRPAASADHPEIPETAPRGTARPGTKGIPVEERTSGFNTVEFGYDRDTAVEEAHRCLACDLRDFKVEVNFTVCKGCGYCKEVCTLDIFETSGSFNSQGYRPAAATRSERCVGCLRCLYICPDFAISIESARGA